MTTKRVEKGLKPVPVPSVLNKPFWAATKQGKLALQRCKDCGHYNHPPKPACDNCISENLEYQEVSGKGKIWSWTLMYQRQVPGFENELPYLDLAVEIDEEPGVLLISNLVEGKPADVKLGAPVEVVFQTLTDEITLPQFRLVKSKKG